MTEDVAVAVTESSQVGAARRYAVDLARSIGMDETDRGKIALVVTELANNLVRHTAGGDILLRRLECPDGEGVEVLSVDRGPGMANLETCLRDGYSTAGTPGTGLGAARRLSSEFEIVSTPEAGTVVVSRVFQQAAAAPGNMRDGNGTIRWGAVCRPVSGEVVNGDAWEARPAERCWRLLVVDGLGHGPAAAEASAAALELFDRAPTEPLPQLAQRLHEGMRHTRGAALALADLDEPAEEIRFVGIGNISGCVVSQEGTRSMMSHNGTVGLQVRKIQELSYPWPRGSLAVFHSDGLISRWSMDRYPDLEGRDPALIAGVLYRDAYRGRDDVTVVTARTG